MRVEILIHFSDLHILYSFSYVVFGIWLDRTLEQRVGQLEGDDSTSLVTNKDDWVNQVECDVVCLRTLGSRLHIAQVLVFVLVEIVYVQLAFVGNGSEDS